MRRHAVRCVGLLILGGWILFAVWIVSAQSSQQSYAFSEKPRDCEINLVRLEQVRNLVTQGNNPGSLVIAIGRLGDGERSQELNRRRLENVLTALTKNLGLTKNGVIVASGQRARGYGRVEFYVGGKLIDALLIMPGKDLCVDCCDIDPRYYPYRKGKKTKTGSRTSLLQVTTGRQAAQS
jgi:hypothetical protein